MCARSWSRCGSPATPLLDLDGDTFALLLQTLLHIDFAEGVELRSRFRAGVDAVGALSATCTAVHARVHRGPGAAQAEEAEARRRCVAIAPRPAHDYVQQLAEEARSATHVWMLRESVRGITLHCAGICCKRVRRALRKTFAASATARGGAMRPLADSARSLAVARTAPVAFVHAHYRKPSTRRPQALTHADGRPRRFGDVVRRIEAAGPPPLERQSSPPVDTTTHELCLDCTGASMPIYTSASPCGRWFAYVATVHDATSPDCVACAYVWDTETGDHYALQPVQGAGWVNGNNHEWVTPPPEMAPQNLGWSTCHLGHPLLVVAWSTTFVHSAGDCDGHGPVLADEHYMLAQHDLGNKGALCALEGPFWGRLITLSLDSIGRRAVALVHSQRCSASVAEAGGGQRLRQSAAAHLLDTDESVRLVHPTLWRRTATGGTHGHGHGHGRPIPWGPSAVGISPKGETIACVHRSKGAVIVETFQLTSRAHYVSVCTKDISNWISMPPAMPGELLFQQSDADLLKLPYEVGFSPCGRFVVVTDRRPLFGLPLPNHAVVVLDLGTLHRSKGMRLCPLAAVDESAPRQLAWSSFGIWMLTRHGACLLQGPAF